jgi:hypothetical protein
VRQAIPIEASLLGKYRSWRQSYEISSNEQRKIRLSLVFCLLFRTFAGRNQLKTRKWTLQKDF